MINEVYKLQKKYLANAYFLLILQFMYARVKIFTISLHTFKIPDFVRFQSPENQFLLSERVRPLTISKVNGTNTQQKGFKIGRGCSTVKPLL